MTTFGAGGDVDAIDSTTAPPIAPPVGRPAGTAIRKGVKYMIGGRRVSSDEAIVYDKAVTLRAKQDRSARLAKISHKEMEQELSHHSWEQVGSKEEGKGEGVSDDGCGAQVRLGCKAGMRRSKAVWSYSRVSTPFCLAISKLKVVRCSVAVYVVRLFSACPSSPCMRSCVPGTRYRMCVFRLALSDR